MVGWSLGRRVSDRWLVGLWSVALIKPGILGVIPLPKNLLSNKHYAFGVVRGLSNFSAIFF